MFSKRHALGSNYSLLQDRMNVQYVDRTALHRFGNIILIATANCLIDDEAIVSHYDTSKIYDLRCKTKRI